MPRSRPGLTWFVALVALLYPAASQATPEADLQFAENSFIWGDYEAVIDKLRPLVEPDILLADTNDQIRAYELLGLCAFYLGREPDAKRYLERLVRARPDRELDPLSAPPEAIRLHNQLRRALEPELAAAEAARRKRTQEEAQKRRQQNTVVTRVELTRNSRLAALLPFGIGQFQNEDHLVGALFLGGELLATALSVGLFLAVEDMRQPDGRVASDDFRRAQYLQNAQVVAGSTAALLMIGGAAHALATFKDATEVRRETRPPTLQPTVAPSAAGLSFSVSW